MSQRRLPAEIYWRRRLFVLAAVIALVWAVLQLTGGDDSKPAAKPTATPTPATPAPAPPTTKVNGVVTVSLVSATKPCDPEKIRITPTVKSGQFTKGPVDIGLVVSSRSGGACTLTAADAELLAVISANGTAIWDSTVCKISLLDAPVSISPQWATLATVQWTGRGSGSKCSDKEGYATPGKYALQIGTLGGEPGKTNFTLDVQPSAPKVTPTSSPGTPKPKNSTKPADE